MSDILSRCPNVMRTQPLIDLAALNKQAEPASDKEALPFVDSLFGDCRTQSENRISSIGPTSAEPSLAAEIRSLPPEKKATLFHSVLDSEQVGRFSRS